MPKTNSCIDCNSLCDKRSKRCQSCSNILNGKSRLKHSNLCKKCGAILTKNKYKYCKSCNMKERWSDDDYGNKTRASIKSSFDIRWNNPDTRKQILNSLIVHNGVSKLEKRVAKIAEKFGFKNSVVVGRYLADLINDSTKIIVEVNGDLWHCNPKFWKAEDIHPNKKVSAQVIWDRDAKRKEYLESLGYSVFVLWEDDINKGKDKFIKEFFMNGFTYE